MSSKDLHQEKLARYREKRSAQRTREPFGAVGGAAASATNKTSLRFVVQKHAARLLHYDFRLEWGGVLWSWAVPKGPSLDPADKRMAVHVEDHPVEYADFEGVIPEKNYGAGEVIVWDKGTWRPVEESADDPEAALAAGKLTFQLFGYKLRGEFALVRTKGGPRGVGDGKSWLLLKHRDVYAKAGVVLDETSVLSGLSLEDVADGKARFFAIGAALAQQKLPRYADSAQTQGLMLCETCAEPFDDERYLFELKLDGYRVLAEKRNSVPHLVYRKKMDATALYPEIALGLSRLPMDGLLLDGEVVVEDAAGRPNFGRLQRRAMLTRGLDIARAAIELPAVYYVFDVLALDGWDLRKLPLVQRKALLRALVPPLGVIRYVEHVEQHGVELMGAVVGLKLEGIVAKRRDSPYRAGRDGTWKKIRPEHTADLAIVGCTPPEGSRVAAGSFNLAVRDGERWRCLGAVGSGLNDTELIALRALVERARRKKPIWFNTDDITIERGHVFCDPIAVVEVRYKGLSSTGNLREPVFLRVREPSEKRPADCLLEQFAEHLQTHREADAAPPQPVVSEAAPAAKTINFSNLKKVFWPALPEKKKRALTKGDLVDYYRAVAPWALTYLRNRPVVLTRYPDGIDGKSFFQKDAPEWTPAWVRTAGMWSDERQRDLDYFIIDDVESLLYIANMGAIPLHIWGSRIGTLETPDWTIIDLDPKDAPFADVIKVARVTHALCEEIGLPSFCKTSGSTGLHVLIPLGRQCTYEQATKLAQLLSTVIVARAPQIATITRNVLARDGRVYLDFLQNGHGKLLAAPFAARPVPAATVSMPLKWSEVNAKLDPTKYDLLAAPARMDKLGFDPLADVLTTVPDLGDALSRLAALLT